MLNRQGTKKLLKIIIFLMILLFIIGYAFFTSHDIILGPEIIIFEPKNGDSFATSSVIIKGRVFRVKEISLNGRPIIIDNEGNFLENVLLAPGYNVSSIIIQDKFKRIKEYRLELVYDY